MATIKATKTRELLTEYRNYALMLSTASAFGYTSIGLLSQWPDMTRSLGFTAGVLSLPALMLAGRSFTKMLRMMDFGPRQQVIVAGGDGNGNGKRTVLVNGHERELPFNAHQWAFKNPHNPQSQEFVENYEVIPPLQPKPKRFWDVPVIIRDGTEQSIRLHEDLVFTILTKAWRAQFRGVAHPLGESYLTNLRYECRGGRRLRKEEYAAFVDLGLASGFIVGRRQGTSGDLYGTPAQCLQMLACPIAA